MELGRLTLLCINLVCLGALVMLVFWALMSMRPPTRKRPRIYSEPPDSYKNDVFKSVRKRNSGEQAPEKRDQVEIFK